MNLFTEFFANKVLLCAITAWFAAQLIKILIKLVLEKKFDIALIMSSGGMPSSHSSTVCALCVATAKMFGLSSPEFAIGSVFAFIVMYDAAGVRRAAGEHAKIINRIVQDIAKGNNQYMEKNLKELIGHTPLQVSVGALLGVFIGLIFPVH